MGLFYKITHTSEFKVDNVQTYNTATLPSSEPSRPQRKRPLSMMSERSFECDIRRTYTVSSVVDFV